MIDIRYEYYDDGSRARKRDPNGNAVATYVDFNGMRLTDIDQHNGATEYFYVNGQKVAMSQPYEHRIHTHGAFNGDWNELRWNLPMPKNTNGTDYTMKAGDLLCLRQYGTGGGVGGPAVGYPDGSNSAWQSLDTAGENQLNQYGGQSIWRQRCADITMGGTHTGPISWIGVLTDVSTPAGTWDLYFADMSITSTDGTVHQVDLTPGAFFPQNVHGNGWQGTPTATVESVATRDDTTVGVQQAAIHFFVNDALGTSQMELSAAGYPVWQGQFAPFGAELDTQTTNNNYKFTGKERDVESGLDYFGARYFGSTMGRFMSPDPSSLVYADPTNPQSLNLYAYVRNNPLRYTDPTGLKCQGDPGEPQSDDGDGTGCVAAGINPDGSEITKTVQATVTAPPAGQDLLYDQQVLVAQRYLQAHQKEATPTPEQYIKAIALAAPTICGGGVFGVAGREVSGAVLHGAIGVITQVDSRSGVSSGGIVEAGGGEGLVGGGGAVRGTDGVEGFGYMGVGGDGGIAGGSVGLVAFSAGGVGVYADGQIAGRMIGGGAYMNISNNATCIGRR